MAPKIALFLRESWPISWVFTVQLLMRDFKTVTPDFVLNEYLRTDVKIVDVRTIEERNDQYIPGSVHIPLDEFTTLYQSELSPVDEIIVYCQHGIRSQKVANFLVAQGYPNVSHMAGGLVSWRGPTESE
jgi:rhodanese-related sulfurtransferase